MSRRDLTVSVGHGPGGMALGLSDANCRPIMISMRCETIYLLQGRFIKEPAGPLSSRHYGSAAWEDGKKAPGVVDLVNM